jgi:butyryl-CoA dehydrogenase
VPVIAPVNDELEDAREFARSVAGVLDRATARAERPPWVPGHPAGRGESSELAESLDAIGWDALAGDPALVACAGLAAVELGRRLAPLWQLDRLLGAAPAAGELVRCLPEHTDRAWVLRGTASAIERCPIAAAEPCPSAAGLDVHRIVVAECGPGEPVDPAAFAIARQAWLAASVGYLAGIGEEALSLTVDYARQRRAFGAPLAALAPVQQRLASAATAVRGVTLLAADAPDADALLHAGAAIAAACADCQQVSGAIAFTLEYPLHRYTQLARGLETFNEALLGDGQPLSASS